MVLVADALNYITEEQILKYEEYQTIIYSL